ncbi:MAG: recombination protein RecR [Parcubacteria group bacterium Gr01-1014_29]|nr:MAG: recombination protein RecR [Parcubacteria group bacterium Gr01-1014_29]
MAYPKHVQRIAELLGQLAGIGPRQAVRLAFSLLEKEDAYCTEFANLLQTMRTQTACCSICFRSMETRGIPHCDICNASGRASDKIMIVEKEPDVETMERSGVFNGLYHITGGVISPLEKQPGDKIRMRELFARVKTHPARSSLEIIIATSNTMEGNQTANYIERILQPLQIKITRLGRGLSTGAEIEYADPLTLEAALKNRR